MVVYRLLPQIRKVGAILVFSILGMPSPNGSASDDVEGAPGILKQFDSRLLKRELIEFIVAEDTTAPWVVVIPAFEPESGIVFISEKKSDSVPVSRYQIELRLAERRLLTIQNNGSVALDRSARFSIRRKEVSESDMDLIATAFSKALDEARINTGLNAVPDDSIIYVGFDGYVIRPAGTKGTSMHLAQLAFNTEEFVKSKERAVEERTLSEIRKTCRNIIEGRDDWVTPAL